MDMNADEKWSRRRAVEVHDETADGFFAEYRGDLFRQLSEQRPIIGALLNALVSTLNALTLWRRDLKNGDFHLVLEK